MLIVTNNPMVRDQLSQYDQLFVEGSYLDVFNKVKALIIDEHRQLLTHPLSGSVKPNETVYKSIVVTEHTGDQIDIASLELMEQAIGTYDKFEDNRKTPNWSEDTLKDFAFVDYDLISNALTRIQGSIKYS